MTTRPKPPGFYGSKTRLLPSDRSVVTHAFLNERVLGELRTQCAALLVAIDAAALEPGRDIHEIQTIGNLVFLRDELQRFINTAAEIRSLRRTVPK